MSQTALAQIKAAQAATADTKLEQSGPATRTPAQLVTALLKLCDAFHTLVPGPHRPGETRYGPETELLKSAILALKAQLPDVTAVPEDLRHAMAFTCDDEICLGLQAGSGPRLIKLKPRECVQLAVKDPHRFIFVAGYGLGPMDLSGSPEKSAALGQMLHIYAETPSEDMARAITLWISQEESCHVVLNAACKPGAIATPEVARLVASLIRQRLLVSYDDKPYIICSTEPLGPFGAMALVLAGASLTWVGTGNHMIRAICEDARSSHRLLAMSQKHGPLEKFLLEKDTDSFYFYDGPEKSTSGLHHYRAYRDLNHGEHFNPEDGAHHVTAENPRMAAKAILPKVAAAQARKMLQVRTAEGWEFAEDVSKALGGYA